jgi:cell division protein FtsN
VAARGRGARRAHQRSPGWIWLLAGILIGLGLAWYLFAKGYIPQPGGAREEAAESAPQASSPAAEEVAPRTGDSKRPKYDFFTVLPEMEVVVPEQELSESVQPDSSQAAPAGAGSSYLLQVGSFREMADAEQMKARLALLGIVARVQTVTVNDATWHRVRAGPVGSARAADDLRTRLSENGIDSLVLKDQ